MPVLMDVYLRVFRHHIFGLNFPGSKCLGQPSGVCLACRWLPSQARRRHQSELTVRREAGKHSQGREKTNTDIHRKYQCSPFSLVKPLSLSIYLVNRTVLMAIPRTTDGTLGQEILALHDQGQHTGTPNLPRLKWSVCVGNLERIAVHPHELQAPPTQMLFSSQQEQSLASLQGRQVVPVTPLVSSCWG